jgi:hypothetical protein
MGEEYRLHSGGGDHTMLGIGTKLIEATAAGEEQGARALGIHMKGIVE